MHHRLILAAILVMISFVGCGSSSPNDQETGNPTPDIEEEQEAEDQEAEENARDASQGAE